MSVAITFFHLSLAHLCFIYPIVNTSFTIRACYCLTYLPSDYANSPAYFLGSLALTSLNRFTSAVHLAMLPII